MESGGLRGDAVAFMSPPAVGLPHSRPLGGRPPVHSAKSIDAAAGDVGSARPSEGGMSKVLLASLAATGLLLASRRRGLRTHARCTGRHRVQRQGLLLGRGFGGASVAEKEEEPANSIADLADLYQKWGLHSLTDDDHEQLRSGTPVQKQERDGATGSGLVIFEVDAPPSFVLECLESFESYPEMIPVVRRAELLSRTSTPEGVLARLNYKISKFWISLTAVHRVDRASGVVRFDLDESCSKLVLHQALGFWQAEQAPDNASRTRVWLRASLRASSLLPHWIIDYAAVRALRRATSWLKPYVESAWHERQLNQLWKDEWTEDARFEVTVPPTLRLIPSMV